MSPKITTALRIDSALMDTMRRVKETEGIPVTTQLEMAVRAWLKARGVVVKAGRKRASTRQRP